MVGLVAAGFALFLPAWRALADDEVVLRLKGAAFEVRGRLKSFDRVRYVIETRDLGSLTFDASRFDCVSANCPRDVVAAPPPPQRAPGLGLGKTVWSADSAVGTDVLPRLVESYAKSIGAKLARRIGSDPRDVTLALADHLDRPIGEIEVRRRGEVSGFQALTDQQADLVWTSRAISAEESGRAAAKGLGTLRDAASERIWGLDALVVVVAKANPATALTLDSIARIFAGQITDWSDVGLPPGRITVYAPAEEMGTWAQFEAFVMTPRGLKLAPGAVRLQHATEWSDKVAADPSGIGVNSIALVRGAKPINIEESCGLVTRPSVFAAKAEEYGLTRRLYLYSAGEPRHPLARAVLGHALSQNAQVVLREAGFIDQDITSLVFDEHKSRVAYALNAPAEDFDLPMMIGLIQELGPQARLSLTFRFDPASFTLDARSRQDVARLRSWLASPDAKGKTVMLLGFSDAAGAFRANLQLAARRSAAVRAALLAGGPLAEVRIIERAYGELAPVACNDTVDGRQRNRRVEVWISQ
jgi:phosphate transport system substrate-binding protein